MYQRRIQLIAGSTYTVSLPKSWVQQHRLKEKHPVQILEQPDGSLNISPPTNSKPSTPDTFLLSTEEYGEEIDHALFVTYYLGIENIEVFSPKAIDGKTKDLITKVLGYMSGTEIIYEDLTHIKIKVFLDKSKVEVNQLLLRLGLLLSASMDNILTKNYIRALERNESEIDRLYHLSAKIIFQALITPQVLQNSGIGHISHILPYFMISKRLENIGDVLLNISHHFYGPKTEMKDLKSKLAFLRDKLLKDLHYLSQSDKPFKASFIPELQALKEEMKKLKEPELRIYLLRLFRYLTDVEEEFINISFYRKLIRQKLL